MHIVNKIHLRHVYIIDTWCMLTNTIIVRIINGLFKDPMYVYSTSIYVVYVYI